MRKSKKAIAVLLSLCLLSLTACSNLSATRQEVQTTAANPSTDESVDGENGSLEQSGTEQNVAATPTPVEYEKKAVDAELSPEKSYNDLKRQITILGLKEYKTLKSKRYTDKASKNKRFLVLFLEIGNWKEEKDYFNVYNFSAKVNGKEISNTVLLNEPENYPTIFANIEGRSDYKGFIAWEVPKNWKKLELTYTGWQEEDALTLHSTLTKKDLKEPEDYS